MKFHPLQGVVRHKKGCYEIYAVFRTVGVRRSKSPGFGMGKSVAQFFKKLRFPDGNYLISRTGKQEHKPEE